MIEKVATVAQYGGAGTAVLFGFTANEIGVLVGCVVGVLGLALNWYYKHAHLKLARERKVIGYEDD